MESKSRNDYRNRYNATHYKAWRVVLMPSEFEQIEQAREKLGLSRRELLKALMKI